jgi:hypothetical protein
MPLPGSRGLSTSSKSIVVSGGVSPLPLRTFGAPCPYQERFRLSPSGSPPVSQPSCLRLSRPSRRRSLSALPCSGLPFLREGTMPSADFCPTILPPHDGSSTLRQTDRSPRVLRTNFPPIYPSHIHPPLPDGYWALNLIAFSPSDGCLLCASCTSGRECAYRFLQTPPRGGSPCGSAHGSRHQGP